MPPTLTTVSYLFAGVLFILSLGGLSNQETARRGNLYGILGMGLAILVTALSSQVTGYQVLIPVVLLGAAIGAILAARVAMTSMPELVAVLHSFVGAAAVLVGIASYLDTSVQFSGSELVIHEVEVFIGVFIGAVTFTGSIVAFLKLSARISSKPLMLPARHWLNLAAVVVSAALLVWFVASHSIVPPS